VVLNIPKKSRYLRFVLFVIVLALTAVFTASAQTALQAQLGTRPITRTDISAYKLPSTTALSGGLTTVGIGAAVHLEAQVSSAVAASDIGGITWTISTKPTGSSAVLEDSPLGAEVPIYDPADRASSRLAGRKLLRPDVAGQYTITANVTTTNAGSANLTLTVTAGTYVGYKSCALCHSAGTAKMNKAASWAGTAHASIFKEGVNGTNSDHYAASCIVCHTVGYDATASAANGGFDDIATQLKWTFPHCHERG
jgi:mono/diheme cytochrome c family protein